MADCKYSYRIKSDINNRDYIYCKETEQLCAYQRFCTKVNNIINLEGYQKCLAYERKEAERMANSSTPNKVRFEDKHGMLVVEETPDHIVRVENPFDYVPEYVKLRKKNGKYYIPKPKES